MKKPKVSNKLWILLAAILVVALVAVGIVLALTGESGADTPTEAPTEATDEPQVEKQPDLYWNVDRELYRNQTGTGLSERTRGEDGLYHITFAVNGQQVELTAEDNRLVNQIDSMDLMSLTLDENGVIVEVFKVSEITGGYAADRCYVASVSDTEIVCNTSETYDGMEIHLPITENTAVYDVTQKAEFVGAPGKVMFRDQIIAVQSKTGEITHIYSISHAMISDVYYNVTRMYNSTAAESTRIPDENGEYVILFAVNGEQVELKARSKEVVDAIDAIAIRCMGLTFDEDGYIVDVALAGVVTGGGSWASWYVSISMEGRELYAERWTDQSGFGVTATLAEDCKVYDVSGTGDFMGQETVLKPGKDTIHCLKDVNGEVCMIFIVRRMVDSEMYWNCDKTANYDKVNLVTLRTPDRNGYYHFTFAVNGTQVEYRTNDKSMANTIDANIMVGLELNGDIITKVYTGGGPLTGGGSFGSWYYVTRLNAAMVSATSTTGTEVSAFVSPNLKIYDVTGYDGPKGIETTLRLGDRIQGYTDYKGQLIVVYVVDRVVDSPAYWNLDKTANYDKTNKVTLRTPDADGYYVFNFAVNGQQKTLKTKSKTMADEIDGSVCWGFRLSGDVITRTYSPAAVTGGGVKASWYQVTSWVGGSTFHAKQTTGSKTANVDMASNCVVYNVSTAFIDHKGEKTTVQVGDTVHCLTNRSGKAVIVYVVGRQSIVAPEITHYCDHCGKEVAWKGWVGTNITESGHYYLLRDSSGLSQITVGNADEAIDVAICLEGRTLEGAGRAMMLRYGANVSILDHAEGTGEIIGHGSGSKVDNSGVIHLVGDNAGTTLNLYGGTIRLAEENNGVNTGGVMRVGGIFNMYGGTLIGGKTVSHGGTLYVPSGGEFHMMGGTVYGGAAGTGKGNNLLIMSGIFEMTGGTIDGGVWLATMDNDGDVKLSGTARITQLEGTEPNEYNLNMATVTRRIEIRDLQEGAKIGISVTDGTKTRAFAMNVDEGSLPYVESDDAEYSLVRDDEGNLKLLGEEEDNVVQHCVCGYAYLNESGELVTRADMDDHLTDCDGEQHIWEPTATLPGASGYYYLTDTATVTEYVNLNTAQEIYLDLNGQNVIGSFNGGTGRIYYVNHKDAKLVITDSQGSGQIIRSGENTTQGGGIVLVMKGSFVLYGGTLNAGSVELDGVKYPGLTATGTSNGGAVNAAAGASFAMHGGTIYGAVSYLRGAAVHAAGTFTMTGGTIYGGTGRSGGNSVYIEKGVFTMTGGEIDGGVWINALSNSGDVTFTGTAKITELEGTEPNAYNLNIVDAAHTVTIKDLQEGAKISITVSGEDATRVFATGASDNDLKYLYCDDSSYEFELTDDGLSLKLRNFSEPQKHCVCGGTKPEGHVCVESQLWNPWAAEDSLPTESGYYYLTKPVTVAKAQQIGAGQEVYLCLNGMAVTGENGVYTVEETASLTVTDCQNQTGKLASSEEAYAVTVSGGFAMYRGEITGGVYVTKSEDNAVAFYGATKADLTLGTASGLVAFRGLREDAAIGITVETDADHAIDRVIAKGVSYGDRLFLTSNITDYAVICDKEGNVKLAEAKDGVRWYCVCHGTLTGSEEHDCEDLLWKPWTEAGSPQKEGNWYLTQLTKGGAVRTISYAMRIDLNGQVLQATSLTTGTNRMYLINNGGYLAITDSVGGGQLIGAPKVTAGGGIILIQKGTLELFDGTIDASYNLSSGHGSAINVNADQTVFNMYGGAIVGGTTKAGSHGGAVYVADNGVFRMTGGTILGGTAGSTKGHNVLIYNGKFTMTGGEIDGGVWVAMMANDGDVTVSGTARIVNIKDTEANAYNLNIAATAVGKVRFGKLEDGAAVGITLDFGESDTDIARPFAILEDAAELCYLQSDDSAYTIVRDADTGALSLEASAEAGSLVKSFAGKLTQLLCATSVKVGISL